MVLKLTLFWYLIPFNGLKSVSCVLYIGCHLIQVKQWYNFDKQNVMKHVCLQQIDNELSVLDFYDDLCLCTHFQVEKVYYFFKTDL